MCGSELAREEASGSDTYFESEPLSSQEACSHRFCDAPKCVGASLLAKRPAGQTHTSNLNHCLRKQACSHGFCDAPKSVGASLLAKRPAGQTPISNLNHCLRKQACSHRFCDAPKCVGASLLAKRPAGQTRISNLNHCLPKKLAPTGSVTHPNLWERACSRRGQRSDTYFESEPLSSQEACCHRDSMQTYSTLSSVIGKSLTRLPVA